MEVELLKRQATQGVMLLGLRRILLQVILTISNIILARLLYPRIFGTFTILYGIVTLSAIFAGLGLSQALVQDKDEPGKERLQTIFTLNLALSLIVVIIIILSAPYVYMFYRDQLGKEGIFYLRLLSLMVIFRGLKEISVILLERKLDYVRIIIGEVLEMFILQGVTIILALTGLGVLAFIIGMLVSNLMAFFIFFILAPWPIGLRFNWQPIKRLLSIGLNFQANTFIGGVNAAIIPFFIGKVSGSSAVGYLNWAGGLATFTRIIAELLGRVIFPVCARIQNNQKLTGRIIEKSIQISCLTTFPLAAILIALARPVAYLIYTAKWLPGVPALSLMCLQSIFLVIGLILTQTLLALGQARTVRNVSLFWAILQWLLTIPLVIKFGFTGMAVAGVLVSATFFIPLKFLRQKVKIEIASHIWPYFVYSLITGGVVFILNYNYPAKRIVDLVLMAGFGGFVYLSLVFSFKRRSVNEDWLLLKRILVK